MNRARLPTIPSYVMPREGDLPRSRADWPLETGRAALLVHDMQAYFVNAFEVKADPVRTAIANIARLARHCRTLGVPVFYTAQNGDQERCDRGLQADLWGPGMKHVPEHQPILRELAPGDDDIVLVKHRYSAFQRSNLETLMRARGRDQLLICGVYAHIGCLFTAAEAFQRDIEPFMAADALADFSREWHDSALAQAADCCARVRSTNQLIEDLE